MSAPAHIVQTRQLNEQVAHGKVYITPLHLLRLPFLAEPFSKQRLVGSRLMTVVYRLRVQGHAVKLAHDVNPDLLLVDHRGSAWRSLDAGTSCPAASSSFAADERLTGFPETVLKDGFEGESDVTFTAPFIAGSYHLVSLSTRRSVALPAVALPKPRS